MAQPSAAQIPSDSTGPTTYVISHVAGVNTHTKTYTIPKLTKGGANGSVTEVNGIVTSYTAPT